VLLPYHLRLAVRSLRRDAGLSATIVVVLAVAAGIFSTAVMHYLRTYERVEALAPTVHQVEIPASRETLREAFAGSNNAPNIVASRSRVSFPNYRVLAGSGLGARQAGTFRGRVQIAGEGEAALRVPPRPRCVRFAGRELFGMFAMRFREGGAWTAADEASGAAVVVLGRALAGQLFDGGPGVGRTVMVDDRPFRVAGVLADEQPFSPEWDRVVTGGAQDALYLPFEEHARLRSRPDAQLVLAPVGPSYADLLGSSTVAVTFWIDLPTPALREGYSRYLAGTLGARGVPYVLRDLATLRRDLGIPRTVMTFFVSLTFLVLLGAGMVTMRLQFAKSLMRQGELSIFRAVGAPRGALVMRQVLEAAVLAAVAGAAAALVAGPSAFLYNRLVADTDIPLVLTAPSFAITFAMTLVIGTLAAVYPAWRAAARRPTMSEMGN
jgi:putative ABC transport system permease protein